MEATKIRGRYCGSSLHLNAGNGRCPSFDDYVDFRLVLVAIVKERQRNFLTDSLALQFLEHKSLQELPEEGPVLSKRYRVDSQKRTSEAGIY